MRVSTRQLRAFLLVAEMRSFTKAARTLHITQAGLSSMVSELELQLDARLFERSSRAVELTEAGAQFLPYARQAVESLNRGALELSAQARRRQGGIRIGVSPLIAATVLPEVVGVFQHRCGQSCEIVDAELDVLHGMLEAGRLDAVYGTYMHPALTVSSERLFGMGLSLVGSRRLLPGPLTVRQHGDWRTLAPFALWVLPESNVVQQVADRVLLDAGAPEFVRRQAHHLLTIAAFIRSGMGIGFVPDVLLDAAYREEVWPIAMPCAAELPSVDFYCTRHRAQDSAAAIDTFSELLAQRCSEGGAARGMA